MKPTFFWVAIVASILVAGWLVFQSNVSRRSIENTHGVKIPHSVRNIQQLRDGWFLDRGILSMFEIDENKVEEFVGQLRVKSRNKPTTNAGDPRRNGWNVWPTNSATWVHGSRGLEGLKTTWHGEAKPIEMLSCESSMGDWLHVEIWSVGDHALVKMYTNWN